VADIVAAGRATYGCSGETFSLAGENGPADAEARMKLALLPYCVVGIFFPAGLLSAAPEEAAKEESAKNGGGMLLAVHRLDPPGAMTELFILKASATKVDE
jgi:hypothetical protein